MFSLNKGKYGPEITSYLGIILAVINIDHNNLPSKFINYCGRTIYYDIPTSGYSLVTVFGKFSFADIGNTFFGFFHTFTAFYCRCFHKLFGGLRRCFSDWRTTSTKFNWRENYIVLSARLKVKIPITQLIAQKNHNGSMNELSLPI